MTGLVLVTGATGFIGNAVIARLARESDFKVRAVSRRPPVPSPDRVENVRVGDLGPETDWSTALENVHEIVHTAAIVRTGRDLTGQSLANFRRVNVEGTLALARRAAATGVRRFIFVSSIKVNGTGTIRGSRYRADDAPNPLDAAGQAAREVEDQLRVLAQASGMEVVIVRPVLVYGPGAKGNFRSIVRWIRRGIPLPLASVDNSRSFVAVDNLVDLLTACLRHPGAANRTFLVSDDEDVSTPEFVRRIAAALGQSSRLFPMPIPILRTLGAVVGRPAEIQRLCGDLQVDIGPTRATLGWRPPVAMIDALRQAVADAP